MPERQRSHVEQQYVLHVAGQHRALHRRADRHHLVGVDVARRFLAEEGLHRVDDLRHARHAADQDHLGDLARRHAGVLQRGAAWVERLGDQVVDQAFELRPRQLHHQVLRPGGVGGDERQVDLGLARGRQLDLRLLGGLLEPLQRELVAAQVDALLLAEFVREVVDDAGVEILAAQEGVAVGGLHLEHTVADLEHRDVERAAAQVIDRDRSGGLLVHAVGERRRGRLVDDAQHVEAGDAAGVLGRLTLAVVEVGGNRDHRLADRLAQIRLGGLLHLAQDEGADLAGRVFLAPRLDPGVAVVAAHDRVRHQPLVLGDHRVVVAAADQALDGVEGVGRVGDRLALGGLADQAFTVVG